MKSIAEIRHWATAKLASGLPELGQRGAQRESDLLLSHLLNCRREKLLLENDQSLEQGQIDAFAQLIERRLKREPLAYITGSQEFFSLDFIVTPAVLIPRPETELLVELALKKFSSESDNFTVVDIGVGSGAIILALASELRRLYGQPFLARGSFIALDLSDDALDIARQNARNFGLSENLQFVASDLLGTVELPPNSGPLMILSNPPYIDSTSAQTLLADVYNYEPQLALFAEDAGMAIIERILNQALELGALRVASGHDFLLLIEIGYGQRPEVESRLRRLGAWKSRFHEDLQGISRIVEIEG